MLKFSLGQQNLSHVQTNSELRVSDVARSQLVEVSKEFANPYSLLLACLSDSCKHIFNIIWFMLNNIQLNWPRLSPGEKLVGIVVVATNSEHIFRGVNFIAEINIIDFIHITLVHISL